MISLVPQVEIPTPLLRFPYPARTLVMVSFFPPLNGFIATDKRGIHIIFFLFLHKNVCCGYSLEEPRRGASNEYHNICFRGEIRNISAFFGGKKHLICCYGGVFLLMTTGFGLHWIIQLDILATICMKCQFLFSVKNKKNIANLLSAELAQRVVKVKWQTHFLPLHVV